MPREQDHEYDDDLEEGGVGRLLSSGTVNLLFGPINNSQAAQICAWILSMNMEKEPPQELTLIINSPGGSAAAAFAIIEIMRASGIPVKTIAVGEICSAGLLIFMNGAKGSRIVTPTCSIMSHQFSTVIGGTFHELLNSHKELGFTHQRILDTYLKCTGLDEKTIKEVLLHPHDAWLTPTQAVEYGIADKIKGL